MLFSVLTQTPCIVIDNKTRKVSGVYPWIHEKNNVKLDEMDSEQKNELIEMVMEDLDDKYRDMP